MSRKKGLSAEEKRTKMMEFFYEKKEFYQLKELEKLCQKEKGITSMSVKEILMSLVYDGMVDTDKIGTSVYFWAFPSKASQNRKRKIDDLKKQLNDLENKEFNLTEMVAKSKIGKEDTTERQDILSQLANKQEEKVKVLATLEKYRECDPEVLEQVKKETVVAKEAANRWTDNIFSTKSWIKNKFSFDDNVIDKQFSIPNDFDYIE
ncbi:meiotic nuclear division protein 1 homolog isoform X2 [Patella vulgata]|nr:meiotic nuclear division protein 1 homolog isoform X2 [Patella vulgata]